MQRTDADGLSRLIMKFTLLIQAGILHRKAFQKIVQITREDG